MPCAGKDAGRLDSHSGFAGANRSGNTDLGNQRGGHAHAREPAAPRFRPRQPKRMLPRTRRARSRRPRSWQPRSWQTRWKRSEGRSEGRPRAGEGAECGQPNDDTAAPGTQRKGALTRLKLQNTRRSEGSRRGEQTAADVRWVAKAALGNPRDPRQPQISEALGGGRPEGSSTPWRRENRQP